MRARITDTRTDRQTHRTESNRFPLRSAIDDVRARPSLRSSVRVTSPPPWPSTKPPRPLPRFPFFSTPPAPTQSFPGARKRNVNVRARVEREERHHLIRDERRRAGPQASALTTRLRQSTFGEQLNEDDTRHPQDTGVGGHSCCHPTYFGAPP